MFLVQVVFEQSGRWSRPYSYLCRQECTGHVVVPTHNYMSVACVVKCEPLAEGAKTDGLKYVYGPVKYDYVT